MKKLKLFLVLILSMAIFMGMLPCVQANAETNFVYPMDRGRLFFNKASGIIVGHEGTIYHANIPSEIDGVTVVGIGNAAFESSALLSEVTLPDSIRSIDAYAFKNCSDLADVRISSGVKDIAEGAFENCPSHMIVTYFGNAQMWEEINIAEGNSALTIARRWFVPIIDVASKDLRYAFLDDGTVEIAYYVGEALSLEIPATLDGLKVTRIDDNAFHLCKTLRKVTISEGIKSIGINAFASCSELRSIDLPDSVTELGNAAFSFCDNLKNITLPEGIETIGNELFFYSSNLQEIALPESVKRIEQGAFWNCYSLKSVTIGTGVTEICGNAFGGCISLSKVYYRGTQEQWKDIVIGPDNESLLNSKLIYEMSEDSVPDVPPSNPFTDVKADDYFAKPVFWAMDENITNGVSKNSFAPNAACTRGQIVTFLWRASGSPGKAVAEKPFDDIERGDYYYEAVLWALENGITTGLTETTFGPNETCTRAQVATFLWRVQGEPSPVGEDTSFTDISEKDYYFDAVRWAVENGITKGVADDRFDPNASCTRGQIVTFLYRLLA